MGKSNEKFFEENASFFNSISPLSDFEKQQIKLEKKEGFRTLIQGNKDFSLQAFRNQVNEILRRCKSNKNLCPAHELCLLGIRKQQAHENLVEYRNKVLGSDTKSVVAPSKRKKEQLLEYNDKEKRHFFVNYLKPLFFSQNKDFVVDDDNAFIIDELFKYFIQSPACKLDLYKGIFLCGNVGTGKSSLMRAFAKWTTDKGLETAFQVVSCKVVDSKLNKEGLSAMDTYKQITACFDDIAVRQAEINSYGTRMVSSDEIIQNRYELYTRLYPKYTHYTSNLDFNDNYELLLKKYDERTIDRIKGQCNFVYLGGKSRR